YLFSHAALFNSVCATTFAITLSLHDALPIFLVLYEVCKPFDWKRRVLWGAMAGSSAAAILWFGESFGLSEVSLEAFLVLLVFLRSEEHTSELQSRFDLVCRLLLDKKIYI